MKTIKKIPKTTKDKVMSKKDKKKNDESQDPEMSEERKKEPLPDLPKIEKVELTSTQSNPYVQINVDKVASTQDLDKKDSD
jgi:hypothetical protein